MASNRSIGLDGNSLTPEDLVDIGLDASIRVYLTEEAWQVRQLDHASDCVRRRCPSAGCQGLSRCC